MRITSAAAVLSVVALAAACDAGSADRSVESAARSASSDLRGVELPEPLPKPDVVLTDARGEPFDLRRDTEGYATLLFFGYTHCPDVCPVTMTNLAAVLRRAPVDVRRGVKVLFVTTDPERDTPERIRGWLEEHGPAFVGLRGNAEEVNGMLRDLKLPPASIPRPASRENSSHDYAVLHPAQVVAWSADGERTVLYPFGTRQSDWMRDLPLLVASADAPATARGPDPPGR